MIKNYLKTSIRNIIHHKKMVGINIFGLSMGLALCLIMLMYVAYEFSFEDCYSDKSKIYRLKLEWSSNGSSTKFAGVMPAIAPAIKSEFPEVEDATRIRSAYNVSVGLDVNTVFKEENFFYADPELLNVFSLSLDNGNAETALSDPYSIILSTSMAKKYFEAENPMGKTLLINDKPYKVTGVIADRPQNTHLGFRGIISYSTLVSEGIYPGTPWSSFGMDLVYVLFKDNFSITEANAKVQELMVNNNSGDFFRKQVRIDFQVLSDVHWNSSLWSDVGPKGNLLYTYLFLAAAILVLVIACLNYINLSTTIFMDRTKEIGVRKVIGANRKELIHQFLMESIIISIVSVLFGIILFEFLGNIFYSFMGSGEIIQTGSLPGHYIVFILVLISITSLVGLSPAIYFSKYEPIKALKGDSQSASKKGNFKIIPVILQFVFSSILICSVFGIFRQIDFMLNSDLGFKKENVIYAAIPPDYAGNKGKYNTLKNELGSNPLITQASGVFTIPGISSMTQMNINSDNIDDENGISAQALPGDYEFIGLLGLELIAGRNFSSAYGTDASESVILNQAAAKALNLDDPIGKVIQVPVNNEMTDKTVIGIVKDFHYKSLHEPITPALIMINPDLFYFMAVRFNSGMEEEVISFFQEKWQRVFPEAAFEPHFMADDYNKYYETEEKAGKMILVFTISGLTIACLGLVGLISFIISKKIKEIGIRKVLGASVQHLVFLLSKKFILWVCIANIIAWPVAYYIMNKWLQNFAYRVGFSIVPFIAAGIITLMIAMLSITWQTIAAAKANPIQSLKYE